jgi:putative heme-binding domain-containing protein
VRQQAAFTLGEDRKRPNAAALAGMLRRDGGDPYIVAAVMSSVSKDNVSSVVEAFGVHGAFGSSPEATAQLAAVAAGYDEWPAAEQVLLKTIAHDDPSTWASQWRTAAAILDEFEKRGLKDTPGGKRVLAPNSEVRNRLAMSWNNARLVLTRPATLNAKALEALRAPAVLLLGRAADPRPADIHLLASLLVPSESMEVQSAAIAALARRADGDAPRLLLAGWKSHSPTTRAQVLDKLLERSSWTAALLDAMERGEVLPADVDAARRQRLLANKDAAQRARAQEIFQTTADADRAAVLDRYRSAATLRGDVQRGAAPFAKKCAACHGRDTQPDGAPRETIGADLAGLTDKSPAALLVAILDPNRAVEPRYLGYTVVLRDGRTLSGMLVEETGTSIALVDLEGKRQTVLRTEIETLRSTGKSFMPEGLEQDLSPQDLADVMAFVAAGMKAEGADSK